jgi:cytochrome c-type biogenesis protein CcmH/NrfF
MSASTAREYPLTLTLRCPECGGASLDDDATAAERSSRE